MDPGTLKLEIKKLLIKELDLRGRTESDFADDLPLFGSGLGLDSLDALQIAAAIEEQYGVTVPDGEPAKAVFASVETIAAYVLVQAESR